MPKFLEDFFSTLPPANDMVVAAITIVVSLLICFLGYKMMKFWIAFFGFVLGFFITAFVVNYFWNNDLLTWGSALVVGLLCAFLAFRLYEAGIFLVCAALTAIAAFGYLSYLNIEFTWWVDLLIVLGAIIVGSLGVMFIKPISILATGINGGFTASGSILHLIGITQEAKIIMIVGAVLAVAGIVTQFLTTRKVKQKS